VVYAGALAYDRSVALLADVEDKADVADVAEEVEAVGKSERAKDERG
jgi:hypothetical protein